MKKLLLFVEKGFTIFALLFFSGSMYIVAPVEDISQSSPGLLVLQSGIQAFSLLLIIARWKSVFMTAIKGKLIWLLVGIALVSFLWSDVPELSLRRSLVLLGTTWFGLYLAARYTLKEQLHLLAWALGIAAVLSVVVALAFPSIGLMGKGFSGAWRGIFAHKNPLGRIMDLSALVFLLLAISTHRYRSLLMWVGFGLSVSLILLSTSKTALALLLTLLLLLPLYRALRWNYSLAVPFFITFICVSGGVAILLIGNLEKILGSMGRDLTLTGRTVLWAAVLGKIWQRPWLGYGYVAFWRGREGESADVWTATAWTPGHSHNGFLDLSLDLGLLGLLAFLLSWLTTYLRAVTWVRLTKTAEWLWTPMYLTFLVLCNLTESAILVPNAIFWVLYVAVTLSISGDNLNYKLRL